MDEREHLVLCFVGLTRVGILVGERIGEPEGCIRRAYVAPASRARSISLTVRHDITAANAPVAVARAVNPAVRSSVPIATPAAFHVARRVASCRIALTGLGTAPAVAYRRPAEWVCPEPLQFVIAQRVPELVTPAELNHRGELRIRFVIDQSGFF